MRIATWMGVVTLLVACSDDTKTPTDLMVPKPETKAGDGPAGNKEASTADKGTGDVGGSKDGAATGTAIGPAGGQAKSSDGTFVLDVPAGALTSTMTFFFSKPKGNPAGLVVGAWNKLAGAVTDTAKGTVTASVDHLTCFCTCLGVGPETTVAHCMTIKTADPVPVVPKVPFKLTAPIAPPQGSSDWQICWKNGDCPDECSDGTKNGKETDVDCGGGVCWLCAHGKVCAVHSDCAGKYCSPATKKCDDCANTTKDGTETDVDCGGATCPKCAIGKSCSTGTDCVTGLCTSGKCATAGTCGNGTKDGTETDVDCGGGACPGCASGKLCSQNTDCMSGLGCQAATPGAPKTCVAVQP